MPPGPTSLQGIARDKEALGFRGPAGGRTAPESLARTEEDNNANAGARRTEDLGSKKKDGDLVLVGGVVSALPPPFLMGDSDNTWTCMEEKLPCLPPRARGGVSSLQKNPLLPLGCPRAPPFPIKGGPRQPRKEDGLGLGEPD